MLYTETFIYARMEIQPENSRAGPAEAAAEVLPGWARGLRDSGLVLLSFLSCMLCSLLLEICALSKQLGGEKHQLKLSNSILKSPHKAGDVESL